jgi:hypothetical protein
MFSNELLHLAKSYPEGLCCVISKSAFHPLYQTTGSFIAQLLTDMLDSPINAKVKRKL